MSIRPLDVLVLLPCWIFHAWKPFADKAQIFALSLFASLLLTGFASAAPFSPSVPIHIVNTNAGRVMTAAATQHGKRIFISGLVFRPTSSGMGAHIHVCGVGKDNRKVWFQTSTVIVTGKPSFIHSESYIVSISLKQYEATKTIFVTFHGQAHQVPDNGVCCTN